ncbi:MAG: sulfur relay protein DsrC [Gammaproteobacteria bacterium]
MLWLSELLMEHHELNSFEELKVTLMEQVDQGEMFFRMDVRPPFQDTPENWEDVLEAIFTSAGNIGE